MVSVVGNLYFLTQFIKSHSFLLVNIIFWILFLKNNYLAILTIFLYLIQSVLFLDVWYANKSLLYSLFHYTLKYLYQSFSAMEVNSWVTSSNISSLFLTIVSFFFWMNSFSMIIYPHGDTAPQTFMIAILFTACLYNSDATIQIFHLSW